METVLWPDSPDRDAWWFSILDSEVRECSTVDVIEQHRDEPLDDDEYPRTTNRDPMAVA